MLTLEIVTSSTATCHLYIVTKWASADKMMLQTDYNRQVNEAIMLVENKTALAISYFVFPAL